MQAYPLVMQERFTRYNGHLFLAPTRLYFICDKKGGAIAAAIGQQFGLLGAVVGHLMQPKPGEAPRAVDEAMLHHAVQTAEGSMVMEAPQITKIRYTMWQRGIWWNGHTLALPKGLTKELSRELGLWSAANSVDAKGLRKA